MERGRTATRSGPVSVAGHYAGAATIRATATRMTTGIIHRTSSPRNPFGMDALLR